MKVVRGVFVKRHHRGAAVTQGYVVMYSKSVLPAFSAGQKLLPRAVYRSLVWLGMRSKLLSDAFCS